MNLKAFRKATISRRVFFGSISAAVAGLWARSSQLSAGDKPKRKAARPTGGAKAAAAFSTSTCTDLCEAQYDACYNGCKTLRSKVQRAICYSACASQYAACLSNCVALVVVDYATATAQWIRDNPGLAILGATVVIGGVTFIVVTGGSGSLVLAPVFAL